MKLLLGHCLMNSIIKFVEIKHVSPQNRSLNKREEGIIKNQWVLYLFIFYRREGHGPRD